MQKCTDEVIKKNIEFMLNDIKVDGVPGNAVFMAGDVDRDSRPIKCEVVYRYGPCRRIIQVIDIDKNCRPIKDDHKIRVLKERQNYLVRALPSYLKKDLYKIFFLMSSRYPEEPKEFIDCLHSFLSVIFKKLSPAVFPPDFMEFFLERGLWDPQLPDEYVRRQIQNKFTYKITLKVIPIVWKIRFTLAKIYETVYRCLEKEVPNDVLKLLDEWKNQLTINDEDWQLFNLSSVSTDSLLVIDNFIAMKVIWAAGSAGVTRIKSIVNGVELYF